MIVSVNWLKKYTDIDLSIEELTDLIGSRLVEIEDVEDLGKKYEGVIVAKVVECKPVEGSDHLNVTKIDDGGAFNPPAGGVERDADGLVQVVCGAPNVREGLTVAWLPPSSTVPETYGDKEPFVLGARELRGVMSNGMLASAKELDLYDDHDGILELDSEAAIGGKFVDIYELNDYLLNIENKSLTHRPDTFGIVGFAREVAGIQGKQFTTPKSFDIDAIDWGELSGNEPTPAVAIDNPEMSRRYQAVVLSNVEPKAKSSLDIQTYLARVGVKPHSAVVDVTNYLMMLTGQPLHAFDYDKLKEMNGGKVDIHVRAGTTGEVLLLLDGRKIELTPNDIVIANGDKPVALAGAMGGRDTEIDDNTTNVLLESATFNLFNLRNTQFRHGIFSEAITRFTKGQPAELTAPVLAEAVRLLGRSAGAQRVSDVADYYTDTEQQPEIAVMAKHMNAALGTDFTTEQIVTTLKNVEFEVNVDEQEVITVTAPYWRTDIHTAEDVDEEVGRLNGFDTIVPTLPLRDFTAVRPDEFDQIRAKIRHALARAGANEVLTYSFVHGDLFKKAAQNVENSYRIVNSISPDLQYYRLTLTPSLLSLVHPNTKAGYENFALFEMNKTHSKVFGLTEDEVPREVDLLALTVVGSKDDTTYYQAKRILDYLGEQLRLEFVYAPIDKEPGYDESTPFDFKRSAMVSVKATGEYVGIIGEYKAVVRKAFKLSENTAGFELDPRALSKAAQSAGFNYQSPSRYPSTERDICFQVAADVKYIDVYDAAEDALRSTGLLTTISPLDIYQPESGETKNVTLRVNLNSTEKTLNGDEVVAIMDMLAKTLSEKLHASVV